MKFTDPDKIPRGQSNVAKMLVDQTKLERGDEPGHDFHGNQYKGGSGGGKDKGSKPSVNVYQANNLSDLAKIAGALSSPQSARGDSLRDRVHQATAAHHAGDKAGALAHVNAAQEIAKSIGTEKGDRVHASLQEYKDTGNFRGTSGLGSLDAAGYQVKSKNLGE